MRAAACVERPHDQSDRALRVIRIGEIVHDVGMREIKLSRCRIVAIAFFGNCQRHDPNLRRDHSSLDSRTLVAEKQHFAHAADHAPANAARTFFHGGIEPILRR